MKARLALCLLAACAREPERVTPRVAPSVGPTADEVVTPERAPLVLVDDPAMLRAIEQRVADFGVLALGAQEPGLSNARLAALPTHAAIFEPLERDLRSLTAGDPLAGVSVRGHSHRTFDTRWLRAEGARFRLIAIANRLDRRAFDRDSCGETRLIYRLTHDTSRLPFTVALELRNTGDCAQVARSWQRAAVNLADEGGPLAHAAREQLVQLALNVQAVRWPSAVRPDLGGHAEYLLRAYRWDGARYLPRPLENTPDVARLMRDRALRDELAAWLREHAREVDLGFAVIPERFLAEVVSSVTPRGFARLANRPFAQLFEPARFSDLPTTHAKTPAAFLRRLDGMSCNGCHEARSVAGFHQLGLEDDAPAANALAVGHSPHVHDDLPRREAYVRAAIAGIAPDDTQPFAEHPGGEGGYGARCGLGADPSFASWTCAPGLRCDAFEGDPDVGACLGEPMVGAPCEPSRVVANADAHRDRARPSTPLACPSICEATRVGFPSGMCADGCGAPGSTCGAIAILTPFNDCLAKGRPFVDCATEHSRPAGLRACDVDNPCRDDYLCALTTSGKGACLPPYFVLQMRVDGHPTPR